MANGKREELGKGINDYLNHYVLVADGKAAAIAAGSLVLIGFTLTLGPTKAEPLFKMLGLLAAAAAAIAAGCVLYPRTSHSGNGHIFWADIQSFESATAYFNSLVALDDEAVEFEYARQNYLVSGVLLSKNANIRRAIGLFCAACLLLAISVGAR